MAKRKSPDKFHVGQVALLVLDKSTGYEQCNGQVVTVIRQRTWGEWECSDVLSSRAAESHPGWRYGICTERLERMNVEENMLRPIYDGEELSTWAKFAKVTGLRLDKELVTVATKKRRSKRTSPEREARHG